MTLQRRPSADFTVSIFRKILDLLRPDSGRSLSDLAKWLELPEQDLRGWLTGPPNSAYSYRRFTIPKRRGGERTIDAPSDDLKSLQRRILRKMLSPLPVHPGATGFVRKRSIVHNARPHARQGVVINLDLADFFHTISAERVLGVWRGIGWNKESARVLTNMCTHEGRLPQGSPTSPALSNLVCRRLDSRLSALAGRLQTPLRSTRTGLSNRVAYTRYADDITLSFERFGINKRRYKRPAGEAARQIPLTARRSVLKMIREIIEEEGFRIQMKKRVRIQRAHQRQTATGLVVNAGVRLPREVRRRIRAMRHRQRLGQLTPSQERELAGWESLAAMVARQAASPTAGLT